MESTSYVLSFRMVFFYLVTTGWVFDVSLCENSIDQSINNIDRAIALFMIFCENKKETPTPFCYSATVSSPVEVGANNVGRRERVRI